MARFEAFERELRLATADLAPEAINSALAQFARAELAKAIAAGAPAEYERFVNEREGLPEEAVRAPGPILYVFTNWRVVIEAALAELVKRSPRRSGKYQSSFVVVVGGRTVVTDYSRIRGDAEVVIFNAQPYTRRIETGSMRFSVPDGHVEMAFGALRRRFGSAFRFDFRFVNVPSGVHPLAPYRLKQGWGRKKADGSRGVARGRNAGDVLTYPAIVINAA